MVVDSSIDSRAVSQKHPLTAHELQAQYLKEVLRYVSTFVRPVAEAEDVVMEVFQAAFQCLHRLRQKDDPRVWLLGIARRKVADSLRRHYRRSEVPLTTLVETASSDQDSRDRAMIVREILLSLPLDQREALVLKYSIGLSTQEIAVVLHRSLGATNSLLQRARAAFETKAAHLFEGPEVDHV